MNPRTREVPADREALAVRVGGELGLRSLLHTDLLLSDFPPVPLPCSAPLRRGGGLRILAQGSDGKPGAADRGSVRSYALLFYSVATASRAGIAGICRLKVSRRERPAPLGGRPRAAARHRSSGSGWALARRACDKPPRSDRRSPAARFRGGPEGRRGPASGTARVLDRSPAAGFDPHAAPGSRTR